MPQNPDDDGTLEPCRPSGTRLATQCSVASLWTRSAGHVLALFALTATAEAAPEPVRASEEGRVRVETAARAARSAEDAVQATESQQAELAAAILERKAKGGPNDGRLERLLLRSVEAERALEDLLDRLDARRRNLQAVAKTELTAVDDRLRAAAAALEAAPPDRRRAVALQIRDMLAIREAILELRRTSEAPVAFALPAEAFDLTADPLDGPEELRDKADFAEDARDKLRKKRKELARLIKDQRRTQRLTRAARDLAVDERLFDEDSRSGSSSPARGGSTDRSGAGGDESGVPTSPGNNPNVDGPRLGADGDFVIEGPGRLPDTGGGSPPAEDGGSQNSAGGPAALDPLLALQLEVGQLAEAGVDLASLEAMLDQVARVEAVLSARARTMRAKARRLESDVK